MHNFFDIFDIEVNVDISKSEIESKYFVLLKKYHPDKSTSAAEATKFSQISSIINDGYNILMDDLKRFSHILEINNININDDAKAPKLPIDILSEILEMQENIEANPLAKEGILQKIQIQKYTIIAELPKLFENKDFDAFAEKVMHLKYINKMLTC